MDLTNAQCDFAFGGLPLQYKQWIIKMTMELDSAVTKHPNYPNGNHVYMAAIVAEESGELVKAAIDYVEQKGHYFDMHHEALQTASSCLRMLLNMPEVQEITVDVNLGKAADDGTTKQIIDGFDRLSQLQTAMGQ